MKPEELKAIDERAEKAGRIVLALGGSDDLELTLIESVGDIPALLAEVERLTKEIETGRHMNAPINLDAASAESFCNAIDVSRLEQENFAKDRQIATLKRALELGAEHIVSLTTNSDCHMKENSEFCMDTISCVDCIQKRFIQQAQEQEAKK